MDKTHDLLPGSLEYAKKMGRVCDGANYGQVIGACLIMTHYILEQSSSKNRSIIMDRLASVMLAFTTEFIDQSTTIQ